MGNVEKALAAIDAGLDQSLARLFALLRMAKNFGLKQVFVHPILDGRDVAPRTADIYTEALEIWDHEWWVGQAVDDVDAYCEFVRTTPLKLGIEADWLPGREDRTADFLAGRDWDYVVGSVHFVADEVGTITFLPTSGGGSSHRGSKSCHGQTQRHRMKDRQVCFGSRDLLSDSRNRGGHQAP